MLSGKIKLTRNIDEWGHDQPDEFVLKIICYDTTYVVGPRDLIIKLINLKPLPALSNLPKSVNVLETQTAVITNLFTVSSVVHFYYNILL